MNTKVITTYTRRDGFGLPKQARLVAKKITNELNKAKKETTATKHEYFSPYSPVSTRPMQTNTNVGKVLHAVG